MVITLVLVMTVTICPQMPAVKVGETKVKKAVKGKTSKKAKISLKKNSEVKSKAKKFKKKKMVWLK